MKRTVSQKMTRRNEEFPEKPKKKLPVVEADPDTA